MLKGKLLIALASAVLFLGACSNDAEAPKTETPKTEQVAGTYTGTVTYNRLVDPTGASTDVASIVMEYKDGKPTSVSIDVLTNGTSKKELAASGGYVMSKEEGALQWHEQIAAVEKALVDNNFDTIEEDILINDEIDVKVDIHFSDIYP